MCTLIFFDINGTIIKRDSRTDIPYQKAIDLFLQTSNGMAGIDTSARSDKDVFIEALEKHKQVFTEEKWKVFLTYYKQQLDTFKASDVWRANVDAIDMITQLSKTDHHLSLITGELSLGAKYKLEKLGVWKYFATGGFGEDGLRRFDIAETAYRKAKDLYGDSFKNVYVIGDTRLDVKTARHLGAKSISITTGSDTREELKTEKPDHIIDNFKEIYSLFF